MCRLRGDRDGPGQLMMTKEIQKLLFGWGWKFEDPRWAGPSQLEIWGFWKSSELDSQGPDSTDRQIYEGNLHLHGVIYDDVKGYRMNCPPIGQ